MSEPAIITAAITGAIHTPSMSAALPVTPTQIADAAVEAAEAGAAIVHLHARNPDTGALDQTAEAFEPILQSIRSRSDCVVNITTGGAPTMTVAQRVRPVVSDGCEPLSEWAVTLSLMPRRVDATRRERRRG